MRVQFVVCHTLCAISSLSGITCDGVFLFVFQVIGWITEHKFDLLVNSHGALILPISVHLTEAQAHAARNDAANCNNRPFPRSTCRSSLSHISVLNDIHSASSDIPERAVVPPPPVATSPAGGATALAAAPAAGARGGALLFFAVNFFRRSRNVGMLFRTGATQSSFGCGFCFAVDVSKNHIATKQHTRGRSYRSILCCNRSETAWPPERSALHFQLIHERKFAQTYANLRVRHEGVTLPRRHASHTSHS